MTRIGASQAFFNIVANFNAEKLITDTRALKTVMEAVKLDTFEAMLKPMQDFGMAIETAIDLTKDLAVELGQAGVEFEKFFGEENLRGTQNELIKLGERFNQTFSESLAAGSRTAQVANLIGRQNVGLLTEQGMILAEISDLTVEESQKAIIKLQQQTGVLYGELTQQEYERLGLAEQQILLNERSAYALNALNTIANRSVALEGDLVQTMTNFASQGKLAGDSFHFMAAASAVMLEAGEEAGTAGRALRMVYARLGGNINGTADKLEQLGFQLRQENGEMKSMQNILQELNDKGWKQLNPSLKQNIAQTIAGNRHYVRFIKLMENFGRATELAAEGELGLDSAADQANKALRDQANVLERAEKRVEFYQAAIGREMSDFMIGSTQLRGDYLDAVHEIQKASGVMGKFMGRLYESMKMTGGFIKMSIAIRSMAVGMQIFEAVQRSAHDVEIANRTLHSKQANYFEFRHNMTQEQKTLNKGLMFQTQNINAAMERQNIIQKMINAMGVGREERLKQITALEEQLALRREAAMKHFNNERNMQKAVNDITAAGNDIFAKRAAQFEYYNSQSIDSKEKFFSIMKDESVSQSAFNSQLMTALEVSHDLDETERGKLVEINKTNKALHQGLQFLKEYNDTARLYREGSRETAEIEMSRLVGQDDLNNALIAEFERRKEINESIKGSYSEDEQGFKDAVKRNEALDALINNINSGVMKVGHQVDGVVNKGFSELTDTMQDALGKVIGTQQRLDLINHSLVESGQLEERINKARKIRAELVGDDYELTEKMTERIRDLYSSEEQYLKDIAPLLDDIKEAQEGAGDSAKAKMELIKMLTGEIDMDTEVLERFSHTAEIEKLTTEQAAQARRDFNSSLATSLSIFGGLIGGTTGATLSLVSMTTQLGMATAQLGSASKAVFNVQKKVIDLAFTQKTEGITGFKAYAQQAKLLAPTLIQLGVIIGATLYFHHQRKEAEKFAKSLEQLNTKIGEMNQSMSALTGSGANTEFASGEGNEALLQMLGLDNTTLATLKNNEPMLNHYIETIENADLQLDPEQGAGMTKMLSDLKMLRAILNDDIAGDMQAFNDTLAQIDEQMYGAFFERLGFQFSTTKDERQAQFAFVKEMNDEFVALDANIATLVNRDGVFVFKAGTGGRAEQAERLQDILSTTVDMIKEGKVLTAEQISMLDAMGSGERFGEVVDLITALNTMTITADEAALVLANLDLALEEIDESSVAASSELQNLTDEISNFSNAREELFFGGKYGNITGSLYKQVVSQGVGVLYNKNEVIVSNVFHGFFNEQEAAERISSIVKREIEAVLD